MLSSSTHRSDADLLCELHRELRECQQRLGTPAERHDDLDHVRALAHEINNRRHVIYLRAALADALSRSRPGLAA